MSAADFLILSLFYMALDSAHRVYRNLDVDESGDLGFAGRLRSFTIWAHNQHATDMRYLKIYDKATAPTVGTDIPLMTIPLKPGEPTEIAGDPQGVLFKLGLGVGATTGIADADTGAPSANDVVVFITHDGNK